VNISKKTQIEQAILGGAFFGGGGGGSIDLSRRLNQDLLIYGHPHIVSPDRIKPEALVATVSFLGAPSGGTQVTVQDQLRILERFENYYGHKIEAFITCENGALSTLNGWLLAAASGRPVLDAPADGRAHPTGVMGALGLEKKAGYQTIQAFIGGKRNRNSFQEGIISGSLPATNPLIRTAAQQARGLIMVIRHPVTAQYVIENGAPGAIRKAMQAGEILQKENQKPAAQIAGSLCKQFKGHILAISEKVTEVDCKQSGGFDRGKVVLSNGLRMIFLNEFIVLEKGTEHLASYPDLICCLDEKTVLPLTASEIRPEQQITLLVIPAAQLTLGTGSQDKRNLKEVFSKIQKELIL